MRRAVLSAGVLGAALAILAAASACSDPSSTAGGAGPDSAVSADAGTEASAPLAPLSARSGKVRVSRGGVVLVDYTATGVTGNAEAGQTYFELNSDDRRHVLHVTILGADAGTYPLAPTEEPGKTQLLLFTDDVLRDGGRASDLPSEWSPTGGALTLATPASDWVTGSFEGTGAAGDAGADLVIEGQFDVAIQRF